MLENEKMVCYCFKFTEKMIKDAVFNNKGQLVIDEIKQKMSNPGCFCETSNPSGKCCLADIKTVISKYKSKDK